MRSALALGPTTSPSAWAVDRVQGCRRGHAVLRGGGTSDSVVALERGYGGLEALRGLRPEGQERVFMKTSKP